MRNVSDVDYSARFHWLLRRFHNGREGLNVRNAQIRLTHILILPARTHTHTHTYLHTAEANTFSNFRCPNPRTKLSGWLEF